MEREMSSFFPSKLLIKPIIATQDYVHSMSQYIDEGRRLCATTPVPLIASIFAQRRSEEKKEKTKPSLNVSVQLSFSVDGYVRSAACAV